MSAKLIEIVLLSHLLHSYTQGANSANE